MKNYNEVPSMISSKDLDYLCDIYNWNFNACKVANNLIGKVEDEEIKNILLRLILFKMLVLIINFTSFLSYECI